MARLAGIQSGNRKLFHCAAHGIPEIDLDLVFQVATGFVLRLAPRASASTAKKLAEEIAEARSAARRARATAKIKSAKIKVDVLLLAVAVCSTRPARWKVVTVEPVLVVHLPLLGIGENIVGFLQLLEFFFRGFVAGVQIRVILPRQLAKRRTDISGVGLARHSQQFVIILFCCRRHVDLEQTLERGAALLRPSPALRQLNSAASTRPRPRTRRRSHRRAFSLWRRPLRRKTRRPLRRPRPHRPAPRHRRLALSCTVPRRSCAASAPRFPSPTAAVPRRLR